jgi:hypothetical protein
MARRQGKGDGDDTALQYEMFVQDCSRSENVINDFFLDRQQNAGKQILTEK